MVVFVVLAILFTWPLQLPVFLGWVPGYLELPLLALAGFGPTLAATALTRGRIWRRLRERAPAWAVLLALFAPAGLALLAVLADAALGGPAPHLVLPFFGALLLPPVGEELGWRGYLHERLADRRGPLVAGVGVGAAWALWHLPTAIGSWSTYPMFALSLLLVSVAGAWLYERAGRRLWVAIALHAGINLQLVAGSGVRVQVIFLALKLAVAGAAAFALSRRVTRSARTRLAPGPEASA